MNLNKFLDTKTTIQDSRKKLIQERKELTKLQKAACPFVGSKYKRFNQKKIVLWGARDFIGYYNFKFKEVLKTDSDIMYEKMPGFVFGRTKKLMATFNDNIQLKCYIDYCIEKLAFNATHRFIFSDNCVMIRKFKKLYDKRME